MLEGKSEKLKVPRDVELTPLKNKNEQEQNKENEKGTKRNGVLKKMKRQQKNDLS